MKIKGSNHTLNHCIQYLYAYRFTVGTSRCTPTCSYIVVADILINYSNTCSTAVLDLARHSHRSACACRVACMQTRRHSAYEYIYITTIVLLYMRGGAWLRGCLLLSAVCGRPASQPARSIWTTAAPLRPFAARVCRAAALPSRCAVG